MSDIITTIHIPARPSGSGGTNKDKGQTTPPPKGLNTPPSNDDDLFVEALDINFCLPDVLGEQSPGVPGELYRFDRRSVSPTNHKSYTPSRSLSSLIALIIPFVLPLFYCCNNPNKPNPLIATPDKPSAGAPLVTKPIRPPTLEVPRDQQKTLHRDL